MNYSIFRFTLNMHNHRSQASVPVFRGDTAVRLVITITDGGNPYHIEDGCIAVLSGTKADGTKLYNHCVIENNNTVVYDFTEQTSCCAGVVNCEIVIYGADGKAITAPKFVIVVDEREVGYKDVVESVSEANVLDNIVSSEVGRLKAEEQREDAEAARNYAESSRISAETARAEAEIARVKAEAGREGKYNALSEDIEFLKLVNEGHTFAFRTDSETASAKHIPSNALPTVVLENVKGITVSDTSGLIPSGFDRITITGKNLVPNDIYIAPNSNGVPTHWEVKEGSTTNTGTYRLNLPDGWYCLSVDIVSDYPFGNGTYFYLQKSTDGGLTFTAQKVGYGSTGYTSDGYCVTTDGKQNNIVWFKVDNANGEVFAFTCHNIAQHKLDWICDIQIEAVEMAQEPSTSYPPKTYAPPTEYTPYKEPITIDVPPPLINFFNETGIYGTDIRAFGHGISETVCNYIDFEKKQYVQMCALRSYENGDDTNPDVIASKNCTLTLYPLDEPHREDISKHWDFNNTLDVQGYEGGFIEFGSVSELGGMEYVTLISVPSTIHYQVKLQGGKGE